MLIGININLLCIYKLRIGIKNAVVESYAKRASREEELELNFKTEQIALLPKDFTMYNRYHYTTYIYTL